MRKLWAPFLLVLAGCASAPSPELDYWECVQSTGSYVQCEHLEVIQ